MNELGAAQPVLKIGGKSYVRRKLSARHHDWRPGAYRDSLSEDFGTRLAYLESISSGEVSAFRQESIASRDKEFPSSRLWYPIAVGIARNGDRHLICRWGMDKLIPFESIKNRSWLYHIHNFGVNLLTSEMFWLTRAALAVFGIAFIAIW